jgi:fructoselysine-6-P-deglycase FrlB-like protein
MNPIEAMQAEVEYQIQDLPRLSLPSQRENCLFVGTGDSYAASLSAQYISGSHALCCYPNDILLNTSILNGRDVYFVSISGNTKANIAAAMTARKQGNQTTAITTRSASKLADVCSHIIELRYRNTGITTAGTISFTSSMLTCAAIATSVMVPSRIDRVYQRAKKQAADVANEIVASKFGYFVLGNGLLHSIALYSALKFNEILGTQCIPYRVEEFCHSPLFSMQKHSHVIIMGTHNDGRSLNMRLQRERFSSSYINFGSKGIELLLQSTFFVQLLLLELAHRHRLTNCYFLRNKKLLKISSDFIYD